MRYYPHKTVFSNKIGIGFAKIEYFFELEKRTSTHIMDDTKTIVQIDSDGTNETIRYQYDNHLGSSSLELDEDANIISYEEYHPFGTTSYRSSRTETEVSLKRYKYTGKERDEETGLYYYGARYYAGWLCRWTAVDPLVHQAPGWTPYHYVHNNPLIFTDSTGMAVDGYTIDKYGKINRVDDTGGNKYDVLYTKEGYELAKAASRETGEKNEYGNPSVGDSLIVSQGSFDNSKKVTIESDNGIAEGIRINNQTDAQAIFKFCADNFDVEYGIVTGDNGNLESIIHTKGDFEKSLTADVAKNMIDNGFFIIETNHSHPGNTDGGRFPSGFYDNATAKPHLEGDTKSAEYIDRKNGAPVKHLMYHPSSGKTYQYNSRTYVEKN